MSDASTERLTAEERRLREEVRREKNWKRWGPYLSERQWGTVREDYGESYDPWNYFTHEDAQKRAYRWGEDGLLGVCDRECRLCFAWALWNGKDPYLKERLFGLTNPQGNHGEDVKELYYYTDATPTSSYLKALYKYPQSAFPYEELVEANRKAGVCKPEVEITDLEAFADGYWDVQAEYAKAGPNDILIRLTVTNRGEDEATIHVLPQLWFRNGWSWGADHDGMFPKPTMSKGGEARIDCEQDTLGKFTLDLDFAHKGLLFCENETDVQELYGAPGCRYPKDGFHETVVNGKTEGVVNPEQIGTKAAAWTVHDVPPGESVTLRLRLAHEDERVDEPFADFDAIFDRCLAEADDFYESIIPQDVSEDRQLIERQAYAGLLWTKQFYFYSVRHWLDGDPAMPDPPAGRKAKLPNRDWRHTLFNKDVLSMPDKWEYPWYAAWDSAFHMIPMARIDPAFAKDQLLLFLREWYMHPSGQIPAYEFNFSDVNPPVHAWACWRVYKMTGPRGGRDVKFLERAFQKLLVNFTWWVNRKDGDGNHIFGGGFLGLDNIGVFDRNATLKEGKQLEQADGTAWMAFYCVTMLSIALELARHDDVYEDIASKFFEHFVAITHALNTLGGTGLWDEADGFYYDQLWDENEQQKTSLRVRSFVGLVPTFACEVIEPEVMKALPAFAKRTRWFREHRPELSKAILEGDDGRLLLSAVPSDRLEKLLTYALDEKEFLSPHGVRSLSKYHEDQPFVFHASGNEYRVRYAPGEGLSDMFGGNSNWRGPVWFPLNYLFVEALERYHRFHGDGLTTACAGDTICLLDASREIQRRLVSLFEQGDDGRPAHGGVGRYRDDPAYRNLVHFYEYFHGDTGRGLGASHQTGWTALVAQCVENLSAQRGGGDVHGARLSPMTDAKHDRPDEAAE